jgi:hypothetical protein
MRRVDADYHRSLRQNRALITSNLAHFFRITGFRLSPNSGLPQGLYPLLIVCGHLPVWSAYLIPASCAVRSVRVGLAELCNDKHPWLSPHSHLGTCEIIQLCTGLRRLSFAPRGGLLEILDTEN